MWRYSTSSPVSSLSTTLIITMGNGGWKVVWVTASSVQASCATEREFGFLLRVLEAGPLGGSTLGDVGTRGAGGATLGGFVWGATLGGVAGKSKFGSLHGVGSP